MKICAFAYIFDTSADWLDVFFLLIRPKTIERAGLRKPEEVGKLTVEALRNGSRYVTVPWYYLAFGKTFE